MPLKPQGQAALGSVGFVGVFLGQLYGGGVGMVLDEDLLLFFSG